jgi:D-glycero-D-manno-heptose 1,7-bisphosphate phosphatase
MSLVEAGLWCQIAPGAFSGQPALFLDRDGVIIVDTNYLGNAEDLRMIEGAAAAIARCNALGIPVVLVTNQSGIARGYYGWDGFHAVQGALTVVLAQAGAHLDAVLACAYHKDGREPLRVADHPWRKPNPGMILEAAGRMQLDLSHSWIVGDKAHDLAAGKAAQLAGGILLAADDQELGAMSKLSSERFIIETAVNLAGAVQGLIDRGRLVT